MSKIKRKKLTVDPNPATDSWDWYQRNAAADVDVWLASIDAGGTVTPFATTTVPEVEIPPIEGEFDFAVIQKDDAGNESDPMTFTSWTSVPLDLSPPPPATGGQIVDL
ncbi:MAG: hypothetical protein KAJ55_07370 [Anaerolineales bacterium]|nr:hypothetical protein [Anaerolineales bacterium]